MNFDLKSIEELSTINLNDVYGFNVTIPYKTEIIKFLDKIDPEAEQIGAVNTIKINRGGLIGFNTDYIGFLKSLPKRKFKRSLIFGTGGASKAIQHALSKINIPFEIVSRKNDKRYLSYSNLNSKITGFDLIINTTPLGTFPNVNSILKIPYDLIDSSHTCYDLIYNPTKTRFLIESEKKGAHVINGLPMLEFQAEASWDIWHS
ncbi:MAG: shikimate dehydrogenase [Flavobacteriaceae bacterium]|nr:shikimate dehydrogenase [Flavobacteriaceae bacterium]